MADIDFDELDKAVHSLMKDANSAKPTTKKAAHKTAPRASVHHKPQASQAHHLSRSAASSEDKSSKAKAIEPHEHKSAPSKTHKAKPDAELSLVTKRRGKFMDMKPTSTIAPGSGKPKVNLKPRLGVDISPVSEMAAQVEEPRESEQQTEKTLDEQPEFPRVQTEANDTDIEEKSQESSPQTEKLDAQMSYSPFLTGAKVDKRPLGTPSLPIDDNRADEAIVAPIDDKIEPPAVVSPSVLPRELHSSVLEVEAHTTGEPIIVDGDVMPESTPEGDGYSHLTPEIDSDSIPPRYDSEGRSGQLKDEPRNSIYEDGIDHSGLAMHNKRSNWFVAVMIVLLLLLGAAGGAVVYLYQTGAL